MQANPCERCGGTGWVRGDGPRVRRDLWEGATYRGYEFVDDPDANRSPKFDYKIGEREQVSERCSCQHCKPQSVFELPADFETARLENYEQRQVNTYAVAAAREWLETATTGARPRVTSSARVLSLVRREGSDVDGVATPALARERFHLFFTGPVGTGKTRLGASLLNEAAARGLTAAFVHVPWFLQLKQRAIDDKTKLKEANQLTDRAYESDVIVLDDLAGGEKNSDYTRGQIVTLLDRRFTNRRRTIITSNLSLQDLSEFFGDDRIPSRIAGACQEVIVIGGTDQRVRRRGAK